MDLLIRSTPAIYLAVILDPDFLVRLLFGFNDMTILVTGVAGFIGMHVARQLLERGEVVVGIDNLNDYYDVELKKSRLEILNKYQNFKFQKVNIAVSENFHECWSSFDFESVIHLAAQAGVRYSLENPRAYIDANITGFLNVLEACRQKPVKHLVYASSSSVYGGNVQLPFSESDRVDHPVSLYAATKKSNELMAHTYSHLFGIPATGLRFFTVYGPWGRPDMSPMLFTTAILARKPIKVFNHGQMFRDFTYIDDIVEGVIRVLDKPTIANFGSDVKQVNASTNSAPYRIFNIGNHAPIALMKFISVLEECLGVEAIKKYLPMQPGDVVATAADVQSLKDWVGFEPSTSIELGIKEFVKWYKNYYQLS